MTYIYPGKIIIKKEKKKDDETTIQYKYILPFYQGAILDFIFHQVPLIRLWYNGTNNMLVFFKLL